MKSLLVSGNRTRQRATIFALLATSLIIIFAVSIPSSGQTLVIRGAVQSAPVIPTSFDGDLRSLPPAPAVDLNAPALELPRRQTQPELSSPSVNLGLLDPLIGIQAAANAAPVSNRAFGTPILNFDGQGYSSVNPSDNVGDIGLNHYIQAINGSDGTRVTVYSKTNGSVVVPQFLMDSLATSGDCTVGVGDPIVVYDQYADRWVLSEFSGTVDALCVYVSKTSDPVSGGWWAYQFNTPNFPDYPKYSVWPDAYYVTTNEASPTVYALDRVKMLDGLAATSQRLTTTGLPGFGFNTLTPADADGETQPPAGSPGLFMRHFDDDYHTPGSADPTQDFVQLWEMDVDWTTPANTTLTGPQNISIPEFDSALCGGGSFSCIPQPGSGTKLDPVSEVVMWRLQYRNFGAYQTMVGSFVVDVGSDRAGVRWYEVRDTGSGWDMYQSGTYSLEDNINRWMSSIAMDGDGNIALGYSVSAASGTFPGGRYTGRLADDTNGTMTQGENLIISGSAANGSTRWGDYNAMSVDPVDECTFWFTVNYSPTSQWATRIANFKFDTCGTPSLDLLVNGGFELDADSNSIPDNWTQTNPTGDKAKCNADAAYTGTCFYQFKSAVGESSKLQQDVDLSALLPVEVNVGDTINFNGAVLAKGTVNTKVKVLVTYTNTSLPKGKIILKRVTPTSGYIELSTLGTNSLLLADDPTLIRVQVLNNGTSGKVRYDALRLEVQNDVEPISGSLIPLPSSN